MTYNSTVDVELCREPLLAILRQVMTQPSLSHKQWSKLLKAHLNPDGGFFGADDLILAYRTYANDGTLPPYDPTVLERLRLRPVRTGSGVAVVTGLDKPVPLPRGSILCPQDTSRPKNYLADETGAERGAHNNVDPSLPHSLRLNA